MSFTRRGWIGTAMAALAALLTRPPRAHASPAPPPPPKRKRWIGHY
jgi:hypothetical protein